MKNISSIGHKKSRLREQATKKSRSNTNKKSTDLSIN